MLKNYKVRVQVTTWRTVNVLAADRAEAAEQGKEVAEHQVGGIQGLSEVLDIEEMD